MLPCSRIDCRSSSIARQNSFEGGSRFSTDGTSADNGNMPRCRTSAAAVLLAYVVAIAPVQAAPRRNTLLNKPAPGLARTTFDHQNVDLAGLRGRVVLLNFWATWCAPCQIEMPRFVHWQEKYMDDGLSILAVSMDDDSEPVKAFAGKLRLNYPVVMGDEKLGRAYGGVLGLPVTY